MTEVILSKMDADETRGWAYISSCMDMARYSLKLVPDVVSVDFRVMFADGKRCLGLDIRVMGDVDLTLVVEDVIDCLNYCLMDGKSIYNLFGNIAIIQGED